jgi:tyrosine-protein phosphatase non-receptor type 11
MDKGQDGSFLVRSSLHSPGNYVLSVRVDTEIAHVIIQYRNNQFDVGGGNSHASITELVENYRKNPMVETSGRVIQLKQPYNATTFSASSIKQRVEALEKDSVDIVGKAGFWEEFEQLQQLECRHLFSRKEGARPENKTKNRYKNILPCELVQSLG